MYISASQDGEKTKQSAPFRIARVVNKYIDKICGVKNICDIWEKKIKRCFVEDPFI